MSKAFGPKGVRARLIASFQLPAHGPAPPRFMGRCRRLDGPVHRRTRVVRMIEDYRRRWRSPHPSGPVLSGGLLLAASDGGDGVSTRTANIDLTPAAAECDVELGWSTNFDPRRSLRLSSTQAVNAVPIAGIRRTANFATPVPG